MSQASRAAPHEAQTIDEVVERIDDFIAWSGVSKAESATSRPCTGVSRSGSEKASSRTGLKMDRSWSGLT